MEYVVELGRGPEKGVRGACSRVSQDGADAAKCCPQGEKVCVHGDGDKRTGNGNRTALGPARGWEGAIGYGSQWG